MPDEGLIDLLVNPHSGRLAQLVERLPYKQVVGGSIPSAPTSFNVGYMQR